MKIFLIKCFTTDRMSQHVEVRLSFEAAKKYVMEETDDTGIVFEKLNSGQYSTNANNYKRIDIKEAE